MPGLNAARMIANDRRSAPTGKAASRQSDPKGESPRRQPSGRAAGPCAGSHAAEVEEATLLRAPPPPLPQHAATPPPPGGWVSVEAAPVVDAGDAGGPAASPSAASSSDCSASPAVAGDTAWGRRWWAGGGGTGGPRRRASVFERSKTGRGGVYACTGGCTTNVSAGGAPAAVAAAAAAAAASAAATAAAASPFATCRSDQARANAARPDPSCSPWQVRSVMRVVVSTWPASDATDEPAPPPPRFHPPPLLPPLPLLPPRRARRWRDDEPGVWWSTASFPPDMNCTTSTSSSAWPGLRRHARSDGGPCQTDGNGGERRVLDPKPAVGSDASVSVERMAERQEGGSPEPTRMDVTGTPALQHTTMSARPRSGSGGGAASPGAGAGGSSARGARRMRPCGRENSPTWREASM